MKPMTANLKILYQHKLLWMIHLSFISVSFAMALNHEIGANNSIVIGLMVMFFSYGSILGGTLSEIINKPFSFCLSDQVKENKKIILLIWLVLMGIFLFVFSRQLALNLKNNYLAFGLNTGIISFGYWIGIFFTTQRKLNIVPFFMPLIAIIFIFNNIGINIVDIIIATPVYQWIMLFICALLSFVIYLTSFNIGKLKRQRVEGIVKNKKVFISSVLPDAVSSPFLKLIKSNSNKKHTSHLWGQAYLMIGPLILVWKSALFNYFFWGCLILVPYSAGQGEFESIYLKIGVLILLSLCLGMAIPGKVFQSFLLFERKEYFQRRIIILLVNLIFLLCFISALNFISGLLWAGFDPVLWKLLIIPVIMLPFFSGIAVVANKLDSAGRVTLIVLGYVVMTGFSFWGCFVLATASILIDLVIIVSAIAVTWGFSFAVLYYDSIKKSLC